MCRKGLIALFLAACLGGSCLAAPEVAAPSCLLMERSTGTVLYEKEADRQLAPASVTKIMTLLLVMEAIERGQLRWDGLVTVSAHAAGKGGSQVFLEENEQMTVRDMVKCVTVSSANDCAAALAEAVAGSESAFVEQMNRRAEELGMTGTHFANCTGLDDEAGSDVHYTTARDIAVMSRELLSHPEIRQFTTIWMDTIRDGTFGLSNTNKLVRFYPDTTGLKTGYTSSAGYCMSASAEREGMELIAAVMHCGSSTDRFESAKESAAGIRFFQLYAGGSGRGGGNPAHGSGTGTGDVGTGRANVGGAAADGTERRRLDPAGDPGAAVRCGAGGARADAGDAADLQRGKPAGGGAADGPGRRGAAGLDGGYKAISENSLDGPGFVKNGLHFPM